MAGQEQDFRVGDMSRTTFAELGVRVGAGAGYSLCHQGSCEHLFAFTDVRMVHTHDPQTRAMYPLVLFQVSACFFGGWGPNAHILLLLYKLLVVLCCLHAVWGWRGVWSRLPLAYPNM